MSLARIAVELREISLKNRPKELYNTSSKGTVPVLVLSDNSVIDESLDIMIWATKEGNLRWAENSKKEQLEAIKKNDSEFKHWLDKYKYHERYPENNMEFYRNKCEQYLKIYENILSNQKYIFSNDDLTFGDAAILPFVRQFNGVDAEYMTNYPNLNKWLQNCTESNLFISTMKKYDFWNYGDKPIIVNLSKSN